MYTFDSCLNGQCWLFYHLIQKMLLLSYAEINSTEAVVFIDSSIKKRKN